MGRNAKSKILKRVNGDVYLAPIKLDTGRPVTSGAPLRRCSNDISISLSVNEVLSSIPTVPVLPRSLTLENLEQQEQRKQLKTRSTTAAFSKTRNRKDAIANTSSVDNESRKSAAFSSITGSENYVVPTNTAISSTPTKSNSTFTKGESNEKRRSPCVKCISCISYEEDHASSIRTHSSKYVVNPDWGLMKHKIFQQRSSGNSGIAVIKDINSSSNAKVQTEMEGTSDKEMLITTATSLDLPVSNRNILQTRSEEWSLKNHVDTALSKSSSVTITQDCLSKLNSFNRKTKPEYSDNSRNIAASRAGDGDMIKTPQGSQEASERDTFAIVLPVPPPPVTAITILNEKPSFTLTFKKPKPRLRPRSIVTNSSSNRGSLPNTASTPNPFSPVRFDLAEEVKVQEQNVGSNEINNNDVEQDKNNNQVFKKESKTEIECSNEQKLPKSVLALDDKIIEGKAAFDTMPVEIGYESTAVDHTDNAADNTKTEEAEVVPSSNVYEPDASFWHSDSTPSIDNGPPAGPKVSKSKSSKGAHTRTASTKNTSGSKKTDTEKETATASEEPTEANTYSEYSTTKSTSYIPYSNSGYPYDSYGSGSAPPPAEAPFVRTEKGAIRFHLPGRIQHKTTIKVAHFPTGEEKNVILNVKPEKQEEEPRIEIPTPPCYANNQNFAVPPYPYNPYGYGGSSPYSMANYYGYYGYPPYQ